MMRGPNDTLVIDPNKEPQIWGDLEKAWVIAGGKSHDDYVSMVNGSCSTGLDLIAKRWAESKEILVIELKADWNKYGKSAGPIRNQEMINMADCLIAFPGGNGTNDCVRRAEKKQIQIVRVLT